MNKKLRIFSPARSAKQLPRSPYYQFSNNQLQSPLFKAKSCCIQSITSISGTILGVKAYLQNCLIQRKNQTHLQSQPLQAESQQKQQYFLHKQDHDSRDAEIIQALNQKAGFSLANQDAFQEGFTQKLGLQQRQSELKRLIYEERKNKDKIYLRNCKLLNACENSEKNTKILKDQSRQNLILICLLASECSELDLQVDEAQQINANFKTQINQQSNRISHLEEMVQKSDIIIEQKTHRMAQLMHLKTAQHKTMVSLYKTMNQLKQEKLQLISLSKK